MRKGCGKLAERLAECLKSLIFNGLLYVSKRLIFSGFKVVGGSRVGGYARDKVAWFGAVVGAKQTSEARVWSILQPKAWLWCVGWVRCGFILHPSFGLVLGLVLRKREKG